MRSNNFVHLHVHSVYSRFDGTCFIPGLFMECERLGMPGFALTDHGVIDGIPELFETAKDFPTIKPIAGCEIYLTNHYDHRQKDYAHRRCYHLILLAKNRTGYENLKAIDKIGHREGFYNNRPRVSHEVIAAHRDGLICTSACIGGEIPQAILAGDIKVAEKAARWYRDVFGDDFYLEVDLQKNCQENRIYPQQVFAAQEIFSLGERLGIEVVAANDVHFISKEEAPFHDMMLCEKTHSDPNNPDRFRYTGQEWFKSYDEMALAFRQHPETLENTMEVFNKVERYEI